MGLLNIINSFDEKFNTIINDNLSSKEKFIFGIARAYLSGAKLINIYKLPENLTKTDKILIKKILDFIKKKCTVICYFNEPHFQEIFDQTYSLNNCKKIMNNLSKIANNNNRN